MKNAQLRLSYRLDQLAHLGLPSQIFIPALLQELHHEIPAISNTFFWQDEQEKLCNIYDEMSNIAVFQTFIVAMTSDVIKDKKIRSTDWFNQLTKPTTSSEYIEKSPLIDKFYKTVLMPMGYHNTCFVPIFHPKSNKRLGMLMVHRTQDDNDFSNNERQQLLKISSIIAHGLEQSGTAPIHTIDGWEQGLLIVDQNGKLHHACAMGEKLLSLASASHFNGLSETAPTDMLLFEGLEQLITNLLNLDIHQQSENPTLTKTNAWGEFKLRAFLIKDKVGNRSPRIGLNIRWQEPFVLKLYHRIKTLDLTPRQETVGLLYCAGDQYQTIADKLNLSVYTVKEHVKNITERLDIRSRADLIQLLLCDNSSA